MQDIKQTVTKKANEQRRVLFRYADKEKKTARSARIIYASKRNAEVETENANDLEYCG